MLEMAQLERENERLRGALADAQVRFNDLLTQQYEERRKTVRMSCVMCSGNLLPVAIVAGHDVRNPLPLKMSTLRFTSPDGGFTHSAPIRSLVCASCGYIQNFIDIDASKAVTGP